MARVIGGFLGLTVAIFLYLVTAVVLGVVNVGGSIPGIVSFLGLTTGAWLTVAVFTVAITTLFAYTIAVLAQLPVLALPATTAALPPNPIEAFMSGYITGLTAGVNFAVWALVLPAAFGIGVVVGLVCFLTIFAALSRSLVFQVFVGWGSWVMPYSYLATLVGILLFVINLPVAVATLGFGAVRFDGLTGTVETTGGLVGITGFVGGFNLGNFTFLSPGPGVGLGIQTPFGVPGVSAHETGHTLTVASFGGVFHWINAIDENVPPLRRLILAYGELIPESHFPQGLPFRHVRIWS